MKRFRARASAHRAAAAIQKSPAGKALAPGDSTREEQALAAGDFTPWLTEMGDAIRGIRPSDVPCNGCTACCTSFRFVHIGPDEVDTLSHIPPELLFPAPLLLRGHVVLGYDERGHCPMLVENRCSIYQHRPRTCRTYDCRVFPAAGVAVDGDKGAIARRARLWQFSFPTEADRNRHAAVRAAAAFIREHPSELPAGTIPSNPTSLAVLAIQIHRVFLQQDAVTGHTKIVNPDPDEVRAEVVRQRGALRAT